MYAGANSQWDITVAFSNGTNNTPAGYEVIGYYSSPSSGSCPPGTSARQMSVGLSRKLVYDDLRFVIQVNQGECRSIRLQLRSVVTGQVVSERNSVLSNLA